MSARRSDVSSLILTLTCLEPLLSTPSPTRPNQLLPMLTEECPSGNTLEELVGLKRDELRVIGRKVVSEQGRSNGFSLMTPVALIVGMEVRETTIGTLASELPCSSALASPELTRYMSLAAAVGNEQAFAACSADDGEGGFGERFCAAWDKAAADLKKGAVMSTQDLVEIVKAAREGAEGDPPQVLVVWRRANEERPTNDRVSFGLVQVSSL